MRNIFRPRKRGQRCWVSTGSLSLFGYRLQWGLYHWAHRGVNTSYLGECANIYAIDIPVGRYAELDFSIIKE